MKKLLFKLLIILSFISFNSISAYSAVATGLATTYQLTITKMELCETGSTSASCLNPITVSLPGIGTALDIAAVTAGETAGTIGNFGLATAGTTYTFLQTTMSRAIVAAGTVGSCTTKANKNGALTTNVANTTGSATGKTSGAAADVTLYVPALDASNAPGFPQLNSVSDADGSNPAASNVVTASHSHFQFRDALAVPFTLDVSAIPTVTFAFSTAQALKNINTGASNCGDSKPVFQAAPPSATITIQGQ